MSAWQTYSPQGPLAPFVECIWFYAGATPTHAKERLLPSGELEVVINLDHDKMSIYDRAGGEQKFRGAVLVAAQSEYFVIDTAQQQCVMGIHFRVGGAFPFFKLPLDDVRDQHISLDMLWGEDAIELRERLLEEPTVCGKFQVIERVLLGRVVRPLERNDAVGYALREFSRARSVAAVTDDLGLSPRRFISTFSAEVGLTPKLFCRVRRFQRMLRQLRNASQVDWAGVAVECGYFDQPHFIHDFRGFTGMTPSEYMALSTRHQNHVPIVT